MLRHWRVWLIAFGIFLVVVAAFGAWWYQDRSQIEAAIAAVDAEFDLTPALVERSPERDSAWRTLQALDLGKRAFQQDRPLDLASFPEDHAGLIAHWRRLSDADLVLITKVFDAVGGGPLWPTAAEPWPDDDGIRVWLAQRLATCPIEDVMDTVARIERAIGWSTVGTSWYHGWRYRQMILDAIAVRRAELSPVMRSELVIMLAAWRDRLLADYAAWEQYLLTVMVDAARGKVDIHEALGVRSPIGDPFHRVLARHQTPGIVGDQAEWVRTLRSLAASGASPDALRAVAAAHFANDLAPSRWREFDLDAGLRLESAQLAGRVADWDLALAIVQAQLRDEPLPPDPIGGGALRDSVKDGVRTFSGAADELTGWSRSDRRILRQPIPGEP